MCVERPSNVVTLSYFEKGFFDSLRADEFK
jgi:hypothetical protein